MPVGTPISRTLIFVLKNGAIVMDWESGLAVDLLNDLFVPYSEHDYSHAVSNEELEMLKRAGRVTSFDNRLVYVSYLPEPPH